MANIKDYIKKLEDGSLSLEEQQEAIAKIEETIKIAKQKRDEAVGQKAEMVVSALKQIEDRLNRKYEELLQTPAMVGAQGPQGPAGRDGKDGLNGRDGKDGVDGKDGKDGTDGVDGISVVDARVDFDGGLVMTLSDGSEIDAGQIFSPEVAQNIQIFRGGGGGTSLPDQSGNSGKYLTTDGSTLSWATVEGGGGGSGTVTSVAMTVPTGLTVSGSPITTDGTLAVSYTAGYAIPTTAKQTEWDTAYNDKVNSASFNTSTGVLTLTQQDGGSVTVDLDGRYLTSETDSQTLSWNGSTGELTISSGNTVDLDGRYLTSYTETDPIYTASSWYTTTNNSSNWDTAYSWGNHASAGYLTTAVTSAVAGTGMSVSASTGAVTFTNTAPDQVVSLTGAGTTTVSGTYPNFTITSTGGSGGGDVTGPASSTDNAITRFDGTTGKLIQNSTVLVGDTGDITGVNSLATVNLAVTGTTSFDGSEGTSGQVLTSAGTGNTPTWTTPTTGTVTSVAATAGTGISVSGSPITSSGTLTITNTAPDQTVVLTAGTGISTSGTYPNFTVTNTAPDQTVAISAGTGISVSGIYPNFTVTNTSPSSGGTVTSVSGTAPIASSGGNTPAISISQATTSTDGYLSSTDWNTFNNKQPAGSYLTSVTADSPLSGSGTSGSHLVISQATTSTDGYLSSTDWNTFNNKQPSGTYVTSVGATSPVTSTGGTTPTIAIPQATSSVSGYLSSTDWNTFNNKGSGTVTSVGITAGTGISVSGSPITSSGSITVTNSSPMTYPSSGIAVSTGSAWGTSLTAPSGTIVGTTDTQTLTNKTLTGFTETVYAVSGTTPALSPTNGTIQTWTLTGNSTPTAGTWADGQSLTLMIADGTAYTVTWTSVAVTWVSATAPTLATTGYTVIELWKVGSTIYGAIVGNVA